MLPSDRPEMRRYDQLQQRSRRPVPPVVLTGRDHPLVLVIVHVTDLCMWRSLTSWDATEPPTSRRPSAWSPAVLVSSARTSPRSWFVRVRRVRIIDALIDGHGGDRRNLADLGTDGIPVEIVEAEIGDPAVADVVADADIIFNLAGQVSHIASMRDPLRDLHLNAITHASFLETVRRVNPTARVVHTSTRQVYGRPLRSPVDEMHPTSPMDVNGVAKLAGEQLHLVYHTAYGMPTTSLRLTNVYGPRQRLNSDELGFLPVFIRKALLGEQIRIFGDGAQRRDCVYVADVVDAMLVGDGDRRRSAECSTSAT